MSLKKYVEAIVASKEERAAALAPARADEQKAALGLERMQLSLEIQGASNHIAELAGQYPLPIGEIIEAQDEVALQKRRLAQLDELDNALFG